MTDLRHGLVRQLSREALRRLHAADEEQGVPEKLISPDSPQTIWPLILLILPIVAFWGIFSYLHYTLTPETEMILIWGFVLVMLIVRYVQGRFVRRRERQHHAATMTARVTEDAGSDTTEAEQCERRVWRS